MRLGLGSRLCCCPYTHRLLDYNDPTKVIWERDYLDGYFDNVGAIEAVTRLESGAPGEFGVLVERMTDGRGMFAVYTTAGKKLWQTIERNAFGSWPYIDLAYGPDNHVWVAMIRGNIHVIDGTTGATIWEVIGAGPPTGFTWNSPHFDGDGNLYFLQYDEWADVWTGNYDRSRIVKYDSDGDWVSTSAALVTRGRPVYVGDELYVPAFGGPLSQYRYVVHDLTGTQIDTVSLPMTDGDDNQGNSIAVDDDGAVYLTTGKGIGGNGTVTVRKVASGSEVWATVLTGTPDGRLEVDGYGRVWFNRFNTAPNGPDYMVSLDADTGTVLATSDYYDESAVVRYSRDFCLTDSGVVWGGVRTRS